jgi:hypothetical protein
MTEDILQDVVTAKMSKEAWDSLQQMFSSSILAHTVQICVELATTKKHGLMWAAYYRKNTGLANELAAANAPMKDDDMITYLLARLPAEYDSFVTLMTTKSTPLTLDDVFTYLMAYEARQLQLQLHHETSADYARRGGHDRVTCGRGHSAPTQGGTSPRPFGDHRGSSSRPLPDLRQGQAHNHSVLVPDG